MECLYINVDNENDFIDCLRREDPRYTSLFQYNPMDKESFKYKLNAPTNGREGQLSNVIETYMSDLSLSDAQSRNIANLRSGHKVVIGGQQAGFLTGPLYTFHKILSLVTLSETVAATYQEKVVPVFWIAGEDHDFDEVNHTFVYDNASNDMSKVKYHTMDEPESSVSNYQIDKEAFKSAVVQYFEKIEETSSSKRLYTRLVEIIEQYNYWTDIFKVLVHDVFKDYGVLLIDANDKGLRTLEKPMLKYMIEHHQDIDQAFRTTQSELTSKGFERMIQTETNVHLFLSEDNSRQLLHYKDGQFYLSKSEKTFSKADLLDIVENEPERFSNNVVTRPIMEEWLFNTLSFVGGPSEIKYWAELKGIFEFLDIEMPIVLPRLRITYLNERISKLLTQYDVPLETVIREGVDQFKTSFVRDRASDTFIQEVEHMMTLQDKLTEQLSKEISTEDNHNLIRKNHQIHQKQYDYLLRRYLLNIERENQISMNHFKEISSHLHPMGGLQERIWNPYQIMNDFGTNVFSPSTYPPLSYTFDQIIVKL
ncbi:bacillithiol biosynthesis cysteine-adding enzyme BshC [Staphylococcus massiliensis]|uniref:bacillithiol biosynthesis cysteine-adding enzyme BshC n=1 Tax=Staphylococcus massiliensis TaxID=555791 RepID=UPI001EE0C967|nr:bacillithiol biosynthesis cysteine-adding enzyme BshC [Staphylococcus massiliensis]MCG3398855.1 bacillithiol biosynthesis cysteine-adding enzyme BshC [Staphylococcus massiliensis]